MIKFINNSNLDIMIDFYGVRDNILLKPNENFILDIEKDSLTFKVSEHIEKYSILMKILGVVLMILFSFILTIFECFDSESIQKSLKFSTKYELNGLTDENEIVIKNSMKKLVAFAVSLNGKALNGEVDVTEEDLKKKVKEYYQPEI